MLNKTVSLIFFAIILSFISSCNKDEKEDKTLNVVMQNSILGCVSNDSLTEGFQYEIIKEFADSFGYQLNITVADNLEIAIQQFNKNKNDILAYALPTTASMKEKLTFTVPLYTTKLVLIQKKRSKKDKNLLAKNISDLEEKTVCVPEHFSYIKQLQYITEESGIEFKIRIKNQSIEKLAEQVVTQKIEYFATSEMTAKYLCNIYQDLDYSMSLGLNQFMAWGINPKNQQLNEKINNFLENFVKSEKYRHIFRKYFS